MVAVGWATDAAFAARQAFIKELKESRARLSSIKSTVKAARAAYYQLKAEVEVHRLACRRARPGLSAFAVSEWLAKRQQAAQALREWTEHEDAQTAAYEDMGVRAVEAYKAILLVEKMEDVLDVVAEAETDVRRERMWNRRRNSV